MAAILFEEPSSTDLLRILSGLESIYASGLLEAEMRSAAFRKGLDTRLVEAELLKVKWIHPDRALTQEIKQIVSNGIHLRGADLWHLACALYFAGNPAAIPFMTLDEPQAQAARRLGFQVMPWGWTIEPTLSEPPARYRANPASKKLPKKKPQPLKGR